MSDIQELIDAVVKFRDERDWEQFHNSKDLALAISVEAGELLEVFLWKQPDESDKQRLKEELADVIAFCLLLAHQEGFDIRAIIEEKFQQNALKYPVEKSKSNAKKYNEL
jgi:NTP pyrophosphatase (non-canonical NTP hydrolase)